MQPNTFHPEWRSGQVTADTYCLLAPNPGPMTLDGTNTWLLHRAGTSTVAVVDPGPDSEPHLAALQAWVEAHDAVVDAIVLTHGHVDHSEGAGPLAALTGAPILQMGDSSDGLAEGTDLVVGGVDVTVIATPGHTSDSLSFLLPAESAILTGDTILGRGTTVVAWPDGRLDDYLASLDRLAGLTAGGGVSTILPGHGPTVTDARECVAAYRSHRQERLEQVRAAVALGHLTPRQVVEHVYADVPRSVWPAAELSVRAQLDYLERHASS